MARRNRAHKAGLMGALAGLLDGLNRNWQTAKAQEAERLKEERLAAIRAQERSEDKTFQLSLLGKQHQNSLTAAEAAGKIARTNAEYGHELTAEERKAEQEHRAAILRATQSSAADSRAAQDRAYELNLRQYEATDAANRWRMSEDARTVRLADEQIGFALDKSGKPFAQMSRAQATAEGHAWAAPPERYTPPVQYGVGSGTGLFGEQLPVGNTVADPYFNAIQQPKP